MAILKYGDYISEKAVYEILLESKVILVDLMKIHTIWKINK